MDPNLVIQKVFSSSHKKSRKKELKYQRTRADNEQPKLKRNNFYLSYSILSNMKADV